MAKTRKDINEKMLLVPELHSAFARYPLDRPRWIRPTQETHTPKADGGELTFMSFPPPPKGETNDIRMNYVWGPGTKGFGYYHLLTKESYVALAGRLHSETAPSIPCCGGGAASKEDKGDLEEVYLNIVYPRSKSPVPKDSYAQNHAIAEARAGFVPTEHKRWAEVKGRVNLDRL
jgi:hypothetical protein